MVTTILKRYTRTFVSPFVSSRLHRRHWFIESGCRLRRLVALGTVFLSQRSNRASVSPVSPGTCRTERVPNRDSVHLVTSQLSRFKAIQRIRLKRRPISFVDSYEIARCVVERIRYKRTYVIRYSFEKIRVYFFFILSILSKSTAKTSNLYILVPANLFINKFLICR